MSITTRLRQVGTSLGVILPTDVLDETGVAVGDSFSVVRTDRGIELIPCDPDADLMSVYQEGADRYRNALRDLAG